jgi:hypothetical protein
MKTNELTNAQCKKIANLRPAWMTDNRPDWMASLRPLYMADNRPDSVPDDILAILT